MKQGWYGRGMATALLLPLAAALAQEAGVRPIGGGAAGIDGLRLGMASGMSAELTSTPGVDAGAAAVKLAFDKTGAERRLLAFEAAPGAKLGDIRALELRYRLSGCDGAAVRLAVVFFADSGASWFRLGPEPLAAGEFGLARMSLTSLRPTAFSGDPNAVMETAKIERVWFGVVIDGPAKGVFEVSRAVLSNQQCRPAGPYSLFGAGPGTWTLGHDPAVKVTMSTDQPDPQGKPHLKYEFTFPGGRHMYLVPARQLPELELDAYAAVRLSYKATLPAGIKGLLFMLGEDNNCQYYAEPPPAPAADWTTVTIPFTDFRLGQWSRDTNNQLDLGTVRQIMVGVHGAATIESGGVVEVNNIEFLPEGQ